MNTTRLGPLLLDLDRTLVDLETHVDYCAAAAELRERVPDATLGETPPTSGWGSCTKETIGRLVGLAGTDRYAAAAAMVSRHEVQGARNARPMPGLAAFLEAVADRPKAIVTLVGPEATALVLDAFGIVVDVVVPRRPDVRPKPFPDQLEEGLRLLGASADRAVMIGDSATDMCAAKAAGVRFVGVTNGRSTDEFADCATAARLGDVLSLI